MKYIPRLTLPEKGNPYYNTKSNGGYSNAIKGNPVCDGLDVLSNCSGYASSRFAEVAEDTTMHYLKPVNAEDFIKYADKSLKVGKEPKLGACIVWSRTNAHGHVGIVEKINSDGTIVTSESGYGNATPFYTKLRKPTSNWGQPADYTFLGFIYQPVDYEPSQPTITFEVVDVKNGEKGDHVTRVQTILKGLGYYTGYLDGDCGTKTVASILTYQQKRNLYQDGIFGKKCWENFLGV